MTETYPNLVGGEWIGGADDEWFERRNPADTSDVVGRFPAMSGDDVGRVLQAAEAGSAGWRRTGGLARGAVLLQSARLLRERAEDLARAIVRDMGKTLAEARAEVASSANFFEYYGGLARDPFGNLLADRRDGAVSWTQREPIGVVVLITPWNDPLATPSRKLAPALLAGNAVIIKPAPESPLTAHHLLRVLDDAGLPPGVVNAVSGDAETVAAPLLASDAVAGVSFTGSTAVGLQLSRRLAGRNVRLQTEMGGKNAAVILADADLDAAVGTVVGAGCGQAGQRCTATSRIVVDSAVHDRVVAAMSERVRGLRVGSGLAADTEVGAIVTEERLQAILDAIEKSQTDGATVVAGGQRLRGDGYDAGYFVAPTLVTGVHGGMAIWHEEVFGPVLAVTRVDGLDEAIERVNDSRYGLASSLFTRDLDAVYHFVAEVDTGQIGVNLPTTGWDVHVPFGGFRQSGSPFKEHGHEGLAFYSRVKSVALARP